jgi:hypothetical protein
MKSSVSQEWHGTEVKIMGKKVVNKSAYEIGLVVEGQAKLLAPKDTGYLAASITTQAYDGTGTEPEDPAKYARVIGKFTALQASEGASPTFKKSKTGYSSWEMMIQSPKEEGEVYVGTPLEYGPFMEFGTVRTSAQPFLRPSLDLAMGKVITLVKKNAKIHFKEYLHEKDL